MCFLFPKWWKDGRYKIKSKNIYLEWFFCSWNDLLDLNIQINFWNFSYSWIEPTVHLLHSQLQALWAVSPQWDHTFKCPYLANRKEATTSPLSPWSLRLWVWITRPTTVAPSQVCRNKEVKLPITNKQTGTLMIPSDFKITKDEAFITEEELKHLRFRV